MHSEFVFREGDDPSLDYLRSRPRFFTQRECGGFHISPTAACGHHVSPDGWVCTASMYIFCMYMSQLLLCVQ